MKFLALIILFVISVKSIPQDLVLNEALNEDWKTYKINFNRKYEELTELGRRLIWEQNLNYIRQHNIEYDLGKHTYYLGLNEFADMTFEEFREIYLGTKPMVDNSTSTLFLPPKNAGDLPKSVDWRKKVYVTEVKHQVFLLSFWYKIP